ncbi:putative periplasmic protein [hydrocarbon metagenome]|uniref:Putative periplasmic protein n=1 Tax=hydrocarbon metagenome TaxID=938273 RepID=A0A0W8E6Y2_9ZZZZ
MKNVDHQLKSLSVSIVIALFALSVLFVNPQSAMALTVSYSIPTSVNADARSYYYKIGEDNAIGTSVINPPAITTPTSITPNSPADSTTTQQKFSTETLAKGTKYATDLYIIDSGKPGPVVMIVGGVHGNETAGFTAAADVKNWQIKKGTLLVLPEANKLAISKGVRYISSEGDLNRDFPQSSTEAADNTLSRAIWAAVKKYDVEWLMDMHEGYDYYKNTSTSSVGQSLIYYPNSGTKTASSTIVSTLNQGISTSYKKFSLLQYPVKGSLARAAGQYLGVNSFIFETCDNPSLSIRVNYQLKAAKTLLQNLDMI